MELFTDHTVRVVALGSALLGAVSGALGNALLRVTVNQTAGFSNGVLGATVDQATAGAIADLLIDGGSAVVAQVLGDVDPEDRFKLQELFGQDAFYSTLDDVVVAYQEGFHTDAD